MCSRYYIDPNMMEEISRVVQNIDGEYLDTRLVAKATRELLNLPDPPTCEAKQNGLSPFPCR